MLDDQLTEELGAAFRADTADLTYHGSVPTLRRLSAAAVGSDPVGVGAIEGDSELVACPPHRRSRRSGVIIRGGIATGVAAAAAAIALVATMPGQSPAVPAAPNQSTALVRLADYVSASPAPAGDAALVARTTTLYGKTVTVYDLYADDGQYFFSQNESGLTGQVSGHHNLAGGLFAREVAAAKLATTGNVQTAAQDMADAADPSNVISPTQGSAMTAAERAKIRHAVPSYPSQPANRYDNYVWENAQDAIIAGSGQTQVRAGVLRILATLPGVTVTSGTAGGQPTLVLTAGTPEMGSGYTEQLTINATTGVPVSFAGGAPGQTPEVTVGYQVSRVTLSDIAAGKS